MNTNNNSWSVYKGKMKGTDYSMRVIDIDYKKISKQFIYKAGIAIPFNWKTENGMPNNVELGSLNKIEDYLAEITQDAKNIMVAVITGNNVEEFLFYTSDPQSFTDLYKDKIKNHIDDHESQFYSKEDSDWSTYQSFIGK